MIEFKLKCIDACYLEGKIWMIDEIGYSLSTIDLDDWSLEQYAIIEQEFPIKYKKVVKDKRTLFFVKENGLEIFKYDLTLNKGFVYGQEGKEDNIIMHVFLYNNEIMILPLYIYDEIYAFNIETCRFRTIKAPLNQCKSKERDFTPSALLDRDKLWFVTEGGTVVKSYDLLNNKIEKYRLPDGVLVGSLCKFENEFLLISITGYEVYRWNITDGIKERYCYNDVFDPDDKYARIFVCNDKVYAISMLAEGIYKVNLKSKNIEKIYTVKRDKNSRANALYMEVLKVKNKIIMLPWKAEYLVEINSETNEIIEHKIFVNEETTLKLIGVLFEKQELIYESQDIDCLKLLNYVLNKNCTKTKKEEKNNKGKIIYQILNFS